MITPDRSNTIRLLRALNGCTEEEANIAIDLGDKFAVELEGLVKRAISLEASPALMSTLAVLMFKRSAALLDVVLDIGTDGIATQEDLSHVLSTYAREEAKLIYKSKGRLNG